MIDQNSRYSCLIAGIAALQTGNARRFHHQSLIHKPKVFVGNRRPLVSAWLHKL